MSSSATHSGTTPVVGGFGRGFGIGAAVLALVIAAGVVFSVNQGNDGSAAETPAWALSQAGQAQIDRYNAMAEHAARNNPENLPSDLKRIYEMIAAAEARNYPGTNVERTKLANTGQLDLRPDDSPGANIERTRMANNGQLGFDEGAAQNRNRPE